MPRIRDILYTWLIKQAAPEMLERVGLTALAAQFTNIESGDLTVNGDHEEMLRRVTRALDALHELDARVTCAVAVLSAAERMLIDDRIQSPGPVGDALAVSVVGMIGARPPLVPPEEAHAC